MDCTPNEGAKLYTKLLLRNYNVLAITMQEITLWMAYLKSKIRQRYCYYITDGTVIYQVTPLWVRLLIPRGKRGRLIVLELQRVTRWITNYLIRISLVYLSVYELSSSTRYTEWIIKKRPSLHRLKRAIIGIYVFLIQIATYQGRIARDLRKRTYQAAYAAIYNLDNRSEVHQIHFDQGFSVLFDNGIHKDDFIC